LQPSGISWGTGNQKWLIGTSIIFNKTKENKKLDSVDVDAMATRLFYVGIPLLIFLGLVWTFFPGPDCQMSVTDLGPGGKTYRTTKHSLSTSGSLFSSDQSFLSFEDVETKATVTLKAPYSISECFNR